MAATGTEILAAAKKASAWGTAVSVGANDGILLLSESLLKRRSVELDAAAGQTFFQEADRGLIEVGGDLTAQLRYDGLTMLLAMLFGTAGSPVQQGGTAAYLHTLQLAGNTDGKFATLAIDKVVHKQEYPSVKVLGATIRGEAGRPLEVTFQVTADDLLAPAVTNTSLASVTYRTRSNRVMFAQGVFRINAQGGAALASPADVVQPAGFELAIRRPLVGDYLAGNANKIAEPLGDGIPEITLSLRFPVFNAATWPAALQADSRYKADIVFTGALLAGAYYYKATFEFPHLVVDETSAQIQGAGKIPNPVSFRALRAAAAPSGMTAVLPVTLSLINTQTTDPLA